MTEERHDLVLVGAGLANGLIALALADARADVDFVLLEAGPMPGEGHTWSFHEHDIDAEGHALVAPLIASLWPGYDVHFPGHSRDLDSAYQSVSAQRFGDVLAERLGERLRTGAQVAEIAPTRVVLADGSTIAAAGVIDGRGPQPSPHLWLGFQKFVGLEVELIGPHGLTRPIVMDARVAQLGGYRFVYVLPFSPTRLLIEDTYYTDGADLDVDAIRGRIRDYADGQGWQIARTVREEHGVLPITLGGDIDAFWRDAGPVPRSGLRAGLFHPTTGYSLPEAVHLALKIAKAPDLSSACLLDLIRNHAKARWRAGAFYRALNRMLFLAAEPERRVEVMRRFYTLPDGLIARFYAGETNAADKVRLLAGRPPVPVGAALKALMARHEGTR